MDWAFTCCPWYLRHYWLIDWLSDWSVDWLLIYCLIIYFISSSWESNSKIYEQNNIWNVQEEHFVCIGWSKVLTDQPGLHFSMSNIYFSTQIAYFTSSLSNMKLMLKAILDQHRNKTLGFCHNGEMDALIYYVIQQNAFALAYTICWLCMISGFKCLYLQLK